MNRRLKYILGLVIPIIVCMVAVMIFFTPTRNLRTRWDCYLDVSDHLADALNEHYRIQGKYPSTIITGSNYCTALDLVNAGLVVKPEFSKTAQQAGRTIKYKGELLDPFRSTVIFPSERLLTGWYYHSASAEWWVRIKGFPLRYFVSKNQDWAVILSNAPDGNADLDLEILIQVDSSSHSMEDLISFLRRYAFDSSKMTGEPDSQAETGFSPKGDFLLLLWEGRGYRINP